MADIDKKREYNRRYEEKNKEKIILMRRARYLKNREAILKKHHLYRIKNKDKIKISSKIYNDAHKNDRVLYYKKNKKKWADQKYKRLFGLSLDNVLDMYKEQKGLCAGCGNPMDKPFTGKHGRNIPCLDHCHTTGKARSLLHSKCNTAIGLVDENYETLRSLAKYVKKHNRC